jgi:hypothetical protein
MFFYAVMSLNHGLAIGAMGLLLCALSDVRPAVNAVRSRFERLRGRTVTNDCDEVNIPLTAVKAGPTDQRKAHVKAREQGTRISIFSPATNTNCPSPSRDGRKALPLSIKSGRRSSEIAVAETAANSSIYSSDEFAVSGFSESSSATSSTSWTSTSDTESCVRVSGDPEIATKDKSKGKGWAITDVRRKFQNEWTAEGNPMMAFFALVAGLVHLVFLTLTSASVFTSSRSKHVAAILPVTVFNVASGEDKTQRQQQNRVGS